MTIPGAVFALGQKRPELKQHTRANDSTELPRGRLSNILYLLLALVQMLERVESTGYSFYHHVPLP